MVDVNVEGSTLRVELSAREKVACLRGDLVVDRTLVEGARVSDEPFDLVRGIRAPGVGLPRIVALGRWRHRSGTDLVVLRRGDRAVVIDLTEEAPYRRLLLGVPDPERVAADLS